MNHGHEFDMALSTERKAEQERKQAERKARKKLEAAAPDLLNACKESLVIFKEVLKQYAGHDASGRRLKLPIERMLEIAIVKAK